MYAEVDGLQSKVINLFAYKLTHIHTWTHSGVEELYWNASEQLTVMFITFKKKAIDQPVK